MGGSSQPKNTTSTTTTQLDPAMRAMIQNAYSRAQGVADQKYEAYGGQMVAPINGMQWGGINQGYGAAQANTGADTLGLGVDAARAAGAYQPQMVGTGQWDANAAQQYMSPYTQNVINTTTDQLNRNLAQTQNNTNATAMMSGAFGGTRTAVANAENERNANQIKAQTAAQLNDAAYTNAQGAFAQDQGRALSAAQGNQQAGLAGANLGLGSAQLLGQLGLSQQQLSQANAQAMLGYGGLVQDNQQQQNEWNYENNYLTPRDWNLRGLQALQGTVSGSPSGQSSSATTPLYKNKTAGVLGGAASGAAMGSTFGPWGTAIGAVGGGLMGMFG